MPPTSTFNPRRYAIAAAIVMNIRLRPGTNVFGKPLAVASISISRVIAVSLIAPSTDRSIM